MPSWQPDFIINLSESDFPVKSVSKLTDFLTANKGRNFLLQQKVLPLQKYISSTGLDTNFVECSGRMWSIGKRSLPVGITYQGGSDWFCLSREFAQYVVNTNDDLVGDLHALMKYTGFGTEVFFHTLLYNSRFCQTHYDSNLKLVSWKLGHGCIDNSQTIDWVGCSPVVIRDEDWSQLMLRVSNDDIFLARKFNPIFDQMIILKLEEKILGKYPPNTPNLNSYWENVYHHHDPDPKNNTSGLIRIAYALTIQAP
ncbi:AGAP005810-PA-like protein [Anopheles sinensis]|uniref:protein xylosyltransferase n=1 Tax=Anopheles sinensis TaxID=74873 RepID=A0A084WDG2_ANOSI|nr:AGAP005810-PA-like protein [Anopheles sinensis]